MDEKKTYGFMDIARHTAIKEQRGVFLDVFVDGKPVTGRCVNADDVEGFATLQVFDAAGKHVYANEGHDIALERVTGLVEFKPREHGRMKP